MEVISDCIISRVKNTFATLGTITTRSQFGGYSVAADKVMFGLILDGELYLRATRQCEHIFLAQQMSQLVYTKRGIPVLLNYYLVDRRIWATGEVLMLLSNLALAEAKRHLRIKAATQRLKDLPNIGQAIERLLWKAGIQDVEALRHYGAKSSYLKLRAIKEDLGVKVLLALEGALSGRHLAALSQGQRSELLAWFKHLPCQ